MDEREIRLRCIEASAKNPTPHAEGYAVGTKQAAELWAAWVMEAAAAVKPAPLGLPGKK